MRVPEDRASLCSLRLTLDAEPRPRALRAGSGYAHACVGYGVGGAGAAAWCLWDVGCLCGVLCVEFVVCLWCAACGCGGVLGGLCVYCVSDVRCVVWDVVRVWDEHAFRRPAPFLSAARHPHGSVREEPRCTGSRGKESAPRDEA